MNILIPCSHCDRYVRSHEERCPFCNGVLAPAPARAVSRALLRSPSRAAAFALRTALVVAPAALACGGEGTGTREGDGVAAEGGSGGSSAASAAPGGSTQSGSAQGDFLHDDLGRGGASSSAGSGGAIVLDDGEADAGTADAAFVPVPIYGGVFPDPVTRARV